MKSPSRQNVSKAPPPPQKKITKSRRYRFFFFSGKKQLCIHWDKLEIKLNEWVKSSLPGLVTSIMQSHVTKIVDDYISSTEFQKSLADSINFDAAGWETQLGSSEKKLNELINSNQAKIAKLYEELTKLKNNLAQKDKAIAGLEDDNYRKSSI